MPPNSDSMTTEDRRIQILEFLAETELSLPPKPIYINLRDRGATYTKATVERHLARMHEEGLLDKPLESGGYYRINDRGREYLETSDSS